MNCQRSYEVELDDILDAPDAPESADFLRHADRCADCTLELRMHRQLVGELRGQEAGSQDWHPADGELLAYRNQDTSLGNALSARIETHLSDCGPCHDAYAAFRILAAMPKPERVSIVERVLAGVGKFLGAMGSLRPAAIGGALVLVLGAAVLLQTGIFEGPRPEGLERGSKEEPGRATPDRPPLDPGFATLTLTADESALISASQTAKGLRVELYVPGAAAEDFPMPVEIRTEDGRTRRTEAVLDESGRRAVLDIEAVWLTPGRYDLTLQGNAANYDFRVR